MEIEDRGGPQRGVGKRSRLTTFPHTPHSPVRPLLGRQGGHNLWIDLDFRLTYFSFDLVDFHLNMINIDRFTKITIQTLRSSGRERIGCWPDKQLLVVAASIDFHLNIINFDSFKNSPYKFFPLLEAELWFFNVQLQQKLMGG